MTGYFAGGSREGLQRARQTQCCSRLTHLAKLNPQLSYGLFVTESNYLNETLSNTNILIQRYGCSNTDFSIITCLVAFIFKFKFYSYSSVG